MTAIAIAFLACVIGLWLCGTQRIGSVWLTIDLLLCFAIAAIATAFALAGM